MKKIIMSLKKKFKGSNYNSNFACKAGAKIMIENTIIKKKR
ncbi:MAG: hypothetical protein ACRCX2_13440 [Paraclostridium sp.]